MTAAPEPARLRRSGALLITTFVVAVLYLVTAGLTYPATVERSSQLTPDQLADIRIGWFATNLLWALPLIFAAVAFALVGVSRLATLLVSLGAVGMVVYFGLMASLAGFTSETLGLDGRLNAATLFSLGSAWAGDVATVLLGVALFRTRVLRKTGVIVAVIVAAFLVVDVLTFLPGLTGEVPLDEVQNLPPVTITLLWLVLGVGLLRRRIPSQS